MIETILDKENGLYPNVLTCLQEYETAKTDVDRMRWEGEFLYWNSKVSADSYSLGKKYRTKFEELKNER